ncbi:MAG: polysaccharide biosynthesis C-terminal domain-containing protein [Bacteroidota bacterium]
MGVIQRQGIRHSIVSVVGIAVGALSTLFIYPKDSYLYGLIRFISDFGMLLLPIISLGVPMLAVRYFPVFKDKTQQHHGFLGFLLCFLLLAIVLSTLLLWGLKDVITPLLKQLQFNDLDRIGQYKVPILIAAALLSIAQLLTSYISNFGRIAVPNIFNNLLLKLAFPTIILLSIGGITGEARSIQILLGTYAIIVLALLIYTASLKALHLRPHWFFLDGTLFKGMMTFAAFAILSSSGSLIAARIDSIMISSLLGFDNNGNYGIISFMANTIQLAYMALIAVAGPIVAEKIKQKDLKAVGELYQKTATNGLVLGIFIFVGVYPNLDDLLRLTGKYEILSPLSHIFVFIGLAKLFDVATSVNHHIINYSQYYRFNLVLVLFLALLNVVCNYLFIQQLGYGEIGAAMATCLSIFLYNFGKVVFIWLKFRLQPFQTKTLLLLLIGLAVLLLASFLPSIGNVLVTIAVRSMLIVVLYSSLVYSTHISEDLNRLVVKYWKMVGERFR